MKLLIATMFYLLLALGCSSLTMAFQGYTPKVGGPGGQDFRELCGDNSALAGFIYGAGKDLNAVRTVCRGMHGPRLDGDQYNMEFYGAWGFNGHLGTGATLTCPTPMVVQGIYVSESSVLLVHQAGFKCRNIETGEHQDTGPTNITGGEGGTMVSANCGDNGYAVGLWGASGSLIDSLGLICKEYQAPVVNTPAKPIKHTARGGPTTAQPKPDKPPIEVLNGDDADQNADNGGGDAGGATAATDTTIYDQPAGNDVAYLSGGDPVTIVSCNGDNWCQISKPQKGWVWGDDLDR